MNLKKYILKNKNRSIFTFVAIMFGSILLFSISILFSSLRNYMIDSTKKNIGSYHVIIKGKIKNDNVILKKNYKNERYYVTYKDIYKVYQNTEKICKNKCTNITYNDTLLSLYGLSKKDNILKTFKSLIYFFVTILGVIIFFIIYNSFKVSLKSRREDICKFKLLCFTNLDIYKLILKESLVLGFSGILLGFILSLILNNILIEFINTSLFEIFEGNLNISIYPSFVLVSLIYMIVIILLSDMLPLKFIKKYTPMEIFRNNNEVINEHVKPNKNIIIWLTNVNYTRQKEKYKSLVICIFIMTLSVNIFSLTQKYVVKCLNKYLLVPNYDLYVSIEGEYDYKKIIKDLKANKNNIYKTCIVKTTIPKEKYVKDYKGKENITITNLGGNEIINRVDKIAEINGKKSHVNYKKFKNLSALTLEGENTVFLTDLKLKDKVIFGLEHTENIIVNLNENEFTQVCPSYNTTLILNTKHRGIDNYLKKLIKEKQIPLEFYNNKKYREVINNIVIVIKTFLVGISFLVIAVMITVSLGIVSINTLFRRQEFAKLESIGLESSKIIKSLFLESLIVSFKGWFYSIPFIFIINKYLYKAIRQMFDYNQLIVNGNALITTLFISFVTVFLSMYICYKKIMKKSIIEGLKGK